MQAPSDDELMELVKGRDQAAFGRLLSRHLAAIHGYVMRLTGSTADAEELAQETFLRVWQRAGSYRPGTVQFTTWLHRIAHNLCIDEFRRGRPETLELPDALTADTPGLEQQLLDGEQVHRLQRALDELPAAQRAALLLCQVQGFSNQQVAEIMNLGVRAVESLLARARRTLREQVLEP